MKRRIISTGSPWEPLLGYSRAVCAGNMVYVSGTTATDPDGNIHAPGDPYRQTRYIIDLIKSVLEQADARIDQVVRTRMFVRDISRWKEYGRAHREVFERIRPANTLVEVADLIDPRMMIEMEVEAFVG